MNYNIVNELSRRLTAKSQSIAVAESVTAGLITTTLSRADNATKFLQGGLTAYNLGQKTRNLNVDPILADSVNCVSEKVCQQMAIGVGRLFCSHWGIAITGYAVPVPALGIDTCFAFYAFASCGEIVDVGRLESTMREQDKNQEYFTDLLLNAFLKTVKAF